MGNKKRYIIASLMIGFMGLSSWGFLAHKTLQQVAIHQLPTELGLYFFAHQDYLVQHSIRPDVRRKDDKTEDVKHYLDMDADLFGPNYKTDIPHDFAQAVKKYTIDSLRKEGLVPWEVNRVYGRLVHAFKANMPDSVMFYAADLGHYVADAHVPLHTTKNHDGQLTDQKGLHVLWESLVPEQFLSGYQLHQNQPLTYIKQPQDFIFQILAESHAMLPEVFTAEKELRSRMGDDKVYMMVERYGRKQRYFTKEFIQAYGDRLGKSVEQRMLTSAHRVASFWYSAWKDAGSPAWVSASPMITQEKKQQYADQHAAWQANSLIKQNLLISLQTKSAE